MIGSRLRETRYWRNRQERRQLARFESLSRRLQQMADSVDDGQSRKRNRLGRIAGARRPFADGEEKPRIVAFGAANWESYGLWPALSKASRFTLWPHEKAVATVSTSERYRSTVTSSFLRFIDEEDARSLVSCVFFYASGAHISLELLDGLRDRGIWTIVLGLDDKHQLSAPAHGAATLPHQMRIALKCDLYWTTWRLASDAINASGGSAWYAPPGGDPQFFRPTLRDKDIDLLFVGSRYGHRSSLVNYLRSRKLTVGTHGRGWGGPSPDFVTTLDLFSRSRIILGNGMVGYMSDVKHLKGRDFEVPMAAEVYLTTFNPELCEFFAIGEEILCYGSFSDCAEIAREILSTESRARRIRESARARCVRDHTWDSRIAQLFLQIAQP